MRLSTDTPSMLMRLRHHLHYCGICMDCVHRKTSEMWVTPIPCGACLDEWGDTGNTPWFEWSKEGIQRALAAMGKCEQDGDA